MKPAPFALRRSGLVVLNCLALAAAGGTQAQSSASSAPASSPFSMPSDQASSLPSSGVPADAAASAAGQRRAFTIEPSLALQETFTDNVLLKDSDRKSDQITELRAGLRVTAASRRLTAYFDYQRRELAYAHTQGKSTSQNALNTFGTLQAIDNLAYLDFSSTISRQAISAFGTQSPDNGTVNDNLTETRNTRVSPYLRGVLGGAASYELRYSWANSTNDSNKTADVTVREATLHMAGLPTGRPLSWTFDLSRNQTSYSSGRATEADRSNLGLTYVVTPQLKAFVTGGREANDYTTLTKETHSSSGLGLYWLPSDRTSVSALREQRFFGESHKLSFEHSSARTVWRYTDTRDITTNANSGGGSIGTVYDLLFTQFASLEPDPVKRAVLVNNYLQAYGLSPTANVTSGFLSSAVTLQRRQDLSFSLLGLRDNITVTASQTESQRLDTVSGSSDDLSNSSFVRQRGFTASLAHRLTPEASLNLLASQVDASGSNPSQKTTMRTLNVNVSTKLGSRSAAILGARRVLFDSVTAPYTETALTGSLNVQF